MLLSRYNVKFLQEMLDEDSEKLPLAIHNYPSRGQTSVQELYQTKLGKLFLKRVSKRNHADCQINPSEGSLAQREYWAYCLAKYLKIPVPELVLLDEQTTLQVWLGIPDAHTYVSEMGPLKLKLENVFDCALFDWLSGQIDRHDANFLYDYVNEKIILIDSGFAFLKHDASMPDYLKTFEASHDVTILNKKLSTSLYLRIKKMSMRQLSKLIPLTNDEQKNALNHRHQLALGISSLRELIQLFRTGRLK